MQQRDSAHPTAPDRPVTLDADRLHAARRIQFTLRRELDLSNATVVGGELARALDASTSPEEGPGRLLLDLRSLTFIDSAGIQVLVSTRHRCAEQGTGFSMRLGDTQVRRVLTVAGITELLATADQREAKL